MDVSQSNRGYMTTHFLVHSETLFDKFTLKTQKMLSKCIGYRIKCSIFATPKKNDRQVTIYKRDESIAKIKNNKSKS